MAILNYSPPWFDYYRKVNALLGVDPEIVVVYDNVSGALNLYVANAAKAEALGKLLPAEKKFGNIVVKVNIIPSDKVGESKQTLFETAFAGNPAFKYALSVEGIYFNTLTYVVFKREVVQYRNDNLGDAHGIVSTLYEEIAREIFKDVEGAFYCTDIE